jgi:hypothetical protein
MEGAHLGLHERRDIGIDHSEESTTCGIRPWQEHSEALVKERAFENRSCPRSIKSSTLKEDEHLRVLKIDDIWKRRCSEQVLGAVD